MLIDLTVTPVSGGVRVDAPGLSFKDLVPILRGHFPDGWIVVHRLEDFRGTWPPAGAIVTGSEIWMQVEPFMDEVESLLLEGGGPLFHQVAFNLYPDRPAETTGVAAFHEAPDGSPGPALPAIPEGGLSFASEDDFLAALGVPLDQAVAIFRILFRAVFVDHPAAARGLGLEGAGRLYEHAARAGGIHFNPEKWRADPEGRVSLANLGRDFHFPCHHAPTEGRVSVIRLTETSDRLLVSEPFTMEVNDYLDRWYDRPVGCRRFIQAGLVGGAIILVLLLILFLTRR